MTSLHQFLDLFFSFQPYVMLPAIILLIALAVRVPLVQALGSTVSLAAGFAGVFIAFHFFISNIGPALQQMSQVRGLHFAVLDVGWPALAAITWASPLAALSVPMVLIANLLLLATGLTRTLYIDLWNYWHFAFLGVLVMAQSGSMWVGLSATLLIAVLCFKLTEWTAPDVQREMGLPGVSASPVSVNGLVPYTVCMDWLFDRIPGVRDLHYNPKAAPADGKNSVAGLLREPMVMGFIMGLALALASAYDTRATLEMAVNIAAVMFLLPRSAGLIGEAMLPITQALRTQVERAFARRGSLVVALDTGFLMGNPSVMLTGLLLIALAIPIALLLPGNQVLPLGDLPNLISVMSLSVLLFRGNVFRAVLAGIPVLIAFLLISARLAPLLTTLAQRTPTFSMQGLGSITAYTDGGQPLRYLLLTLYAGEPWAWAAAGVLLAALWLTRQRYQRLQAQLDAQLLAQPDAPVQPAQAQPLELQQAA